MRRNLQLGHSNQFRDVAGNNFIAFCRLVRNPVGSVVKRLCLDFPYRLKGVTLFASFLQWNQRQKLLVIKERPISWLMILLTFRIRDGFFIGFRKAPLWFCSAQSNSAHFHVHWWSYDWNRSGDKEERNLFIISYHQLFSFLFDLCTFKFCMWAYAEKIVKTRYMNAVIKVDDSVNILTLWLKFSSHIPR